MRSKKDWDSGSRKALSSPKKLIGLGYPLGTLLMYFYFLFNLTIYL